MPSGQMSPLMTVILQTDTVKYDTNYNHVCFMYFRTVASKPP